MRFDISNKLNSIPKEAFELLNKSELARRLGCDPRTIDRHIKIQQRTLVPKERKKRKSVLDEYKDCILDKVDNHGATAMAVYKLSRRKVGLCLPNPSINVSIVCKTTNCSHCFKCLTL